jgi:hypothetical protein
VLEEYGGAGNRDFRFNATLVEEFANTSSRRAIAPRRQLSHMPGPALERPASRSVLHVRPPAPGTAAEETRNAATTHPQQTDRSTARRTMNKFESCADLKPCALSRSEE